jgi:hypothetical protein
MAHTYRELAEQLEPHERRAVRHAAFWFLFAYLEVWTFYGAGTDLVLIAAGAGLVVSFIRPLRARGSFVALHVAIAASLIEMVHRAPSVILVVELILLIVLVVAQLRQPSALIAASLLLLHALAVAVDPWSAVTKGANLTTFAHATARLFAIVMMLSMIVSERARAAIARRPVLAPPPPRIVPSVAQWERWSR